MIPVLVVVAVVAGALALLDGIVRLRGRGSSVVAIIEIIVAAAFLASFIPQLVAFVPLGAMILAVVLLIVLVVQLALRGTTRAGGITLTVISIVLLAAWIVLTQGWLSIPGVV